MGLTSALFVFVFFPLCVAGYYLLALAEKRWERIKRLRFKDVFLVLASIAFYGWASLAGIPKLLLFIAAVYIAGIVVQYWRERGRATKVMAALAVTVLLLLACLLFYKYYGFAAGTVNALAGGTVLPARTILAPLGISFLIFSCISYVVDTYRGQPGESLLDAALYLTFFPKVVSGPIALWRDFGPQISDRRESPQLFVTGLNRIMLGFGKKVILADTFGALAAEIQKNVALGIDVPTAWGCAFIYMLQIYYDFSGYSDIAIGLGNLFGFQIKKNFDFPYISRSVSEFWRRWHISLGTWFREYVYIPLGGSRRGKGRTLLNLGIVFLLTGIWHGAGWGYIIWGVMHGLCCIAERCMENTKLYRKIPGVVKWAFTMFIVMIGWEFFRLGTASQALRFLKIMAGLSRPEEVTLSFPYFFRTKIIFLTLVAVMGAWLPNLAVCRRFQERVSSSPALYCVQEALLLVLMVTAVLFMVNSVYSPFIYFQY